MQISDLVRYAEVSIVLWVFIGLFYLGLKISPKKVAIKAYEVLCMKARKEKRPWWDYDKWDAFLTANGAVFHYGGWMNPVSYIALCVVAGFCGFMIGTWSGFWLGCAGALIGIFLPGILLEYMNKRDNEQMLTELDMLYGALSIQIRAGVYVSNALMECYGSVSHPRLRASLQDLCSDLVVNAELGKALEGLQRKFNNKYIDILCITILQACESGQAVELLGDIAEQIKDMEVLIQQKKKDQLDRSTTFYQLGVFVISMGLTLYLCISNMFSASLFFN